MRLLFAAIAFLCLFAPPPVSAQQPVAVGPALECVMWGPERADCFARGVDSRMHHRWRDGAGWGGWELLGGTLRGEISCVAFAANRINCFGRGEDSAIWHRWWAGGPLWQPIAPITGDWASIGGASASSPSCVSWTADRIDCFIVGRDQTLARNTLRNGRWTTWMRIPGLFITGGPHCIVTNDGSARSATAPAEPNDAITCFAEGPNRALWGVVLPATPGVGEPRWIDLGGVMNSRVSCVARQVGTSECFVRGTDDAMYGQFFGSSLAGRGWRHMGGILTSEPECVAASAERVDCFVRGTDGALYRAFGQYRRDGGDTWSAWESLGGAIASAPTCATYRASLAAEASINIRIDCFARDRRGATQHIAWQTTGASRWQNLGGNISR